MTPIEPDEFAHLEVALTKSAREKKKRFDDQQAYGPLALHSVVNKCDGYYDLPLLY